VVSREDSQTEELTPGTDEALQQSLDLLKSTLPEDYPWPHREGLVQALKRESTTWLTNVKVDVTSHLAERMVRWIVVRLEVVIDQPGIAEGHLWTIARHIVSTLTWHEEKEVARALADGKPVPSPPSYVKPDGIDELLDAAVLEKLPALDQETKDHIWRLFEGTLLAQIGGALPLCSSNFGKRADDERYGSLVASHQDETNRLCFHRWKPYFAFHLKMVRDFEEAQDQRPQVVPEPSTHPTNSWLRRKVKKIAKSEGWRLPKRATRRAMAELKNVILQADVNGRCQSTHRALTESFVSVACGWFISGGFLDSAIIDGQTLRQGTSNHHQDPKRDLPASEGSRTAQDLPSLRGPSSTPFRNAIYADRHDDLAQAHVVLPATT
jgi:hypothetical protein